MILQDAWLSHSGTQALCAALAQSGHRVWFVGGCVRNALLGVPVSDIDLATDARPDTIIRVAEAAGFRAIPTGIAHGTVTVIAQDRQHEVTTLRRDVATDGRRAVVAFTDDLALDASRRDFTLNALYALPSGEVIDPLGGMADVLARKVRFVGDPHQRIHEDYLRILRFFRFHAVYGDPTGGIDPEGLAACAELSDGIATLSGERLGAELRKLLAAANPAPAVAAMAQAGILTLVLPGADPRALAPLVHLDGDITPRWQRRLVVLGGSTEDLRLSRQEQAEIGHIRDEIASALSPAALGWMLGDIPATDVILCRAALFETAPPKDWQADVRRGTRSILPITAADLMPDLHGPALGARLKSLQSQWLASDLGLDKAALLHGSDD